MPDRAAARRARSGSTTRTRAAVYYTALLVNVGCHSDAHEQAKWFGDDIALKSTKYDHELRERARQSRRRCAAWSAPATRRCTASASGSSSRSRAHREVDGMIAQHAALARSARPSSSGSRRRAATRSARRTSSGTARAGRASSRATRSRSPRGIAQLAEFVEVAHRIGGVDAATRARAASAAGTQFDPALVALALRRTPTTILGGLDAVAHVGRGDRRRAGARGRARRATEFDAALLAIANFVDLKSPYTLGHSRAVAELAAAAGGAARAAGRRGAHAAPRRPRARLRPARRVERDLGQARAARRRRVGARAHCTRT